MKWKIYYDNGTAFSNRDGNVVDAPARGVQVIVQVDKYHGWYTETAYDYYIWDDRGEGHKWIGVDFVGVIDYIIEPGWKCILLGRTVSNKRFNEIFQKAKNDLEFGKKTAFRRWEKKPIE
jgi:hypothetical protein